MLLKVTAEDGGSFHGGSGRWPLPTRNEDGTWTPGEWRDLDAGRAKPRALVACEYGLHVFEPKNIIRWIGPALWIAEVEGETLDNGDKVVARKARLVRPVEHWIPALRTWALDSANHACDDAEKVLANFEAWAPSDDRPRKAIAAARACIAAVRSGDARSTSWSAARSAAWSARGSAADWQTRRLIELLGIDESGTARLPEMWSQAAELI